MDYDPMVDANACRTRWPEQRFTSNRRWTLTPRTACFTCGCFTIPVRVQHAEAPGEQRVEIPGRYPCPVCGQIDQYVDVWITARGEHHAASRQSLRERGYVTLRHGRLRAPRQEELPNVAGMPRRAPAGGPLFVRLDETMGANASVEKRYASPDAPDPVSPTAPDRFDTSTGGYRPHMTRSGPIPYFIHGIIEYLAAVAFLVAPFVLDFRSDAATYLSMAVGVIVLVVAATTVGRTSLVDQIPISLHVALDYALAVLLIALPFLFGFSEERNPTIWFIALGVIHLLLTIATRFDPGETHKPRRGGDGVGALARGTSVDVEAGERTVLDEPK